LVNHESDNFYTIDFRCDSHGQRNTNNIFIPFRPFLREAKLMIEVLDLVTLLLLVPGMAFAANVQHHGSTGSIGIEGYLIDPTMIARIPQTVTDSSNNDSSAIDVIFAGVTNDIIGYHFVGDITNIGTAAISNVQVTVHLDDSNTEVANSTQYIKPENLGVGKTTTFNTFV
jgi:hypothetical protein